jgi:hypothetical protein
MELKSHMGGACALLIGPMIMAKTRLLFLLFLLHPLYSRLIVF